MSQALARTENPYYETLDRLFAITTGVVIFLCLISLPFFRLTDESRLWYLSILGAATITAVARYIVLKNKIDYDTGYFITDILNPLFIASLIHVSGRFGIYLFFLFFLQIISSTAIMKFRHVVVSMAMIAGSTIYLFFIDNNFQLNQTESYVGGFMLLIVLFLIAVYTIVIMQQQMNAMVKIRNQKSQFIQDVSHELRTPLTVIKGVVDVLRDARWQPFSQGNQLDSAQYGNNRIINHLHSAAQDLETIAERLSEQSREKIEADEQIKMNTTAGKQIMRVANRTQSLAAKLVHIKQPHPNRNVEK